MRSAGVMVVGLIVAGVGCRAESWAEVDPLAGVDLGRVKEAKWVDLGVEPTRRGGVGYAVLSTESIKCADLVKVGVPWASPQDSFMADSTGVVVYYQWSSSAPSSFEGTYLQGGYAYDEDYDERLFGVLVYENGMSRGSTYEGGSSEVSLYSRSSVLGTFDTPVASGRFNAENCGTYEGGGYGYY